MSFSYFRKVDERGIVSIQNLWRKTMNTTSSLRHQVQYSQCSLSAADKTGLTEGICCPTIIAQLVYEYMYIINYYVKNQNFR